MYPLLSLSQIDIDAPLARRLPRRLAYYHLALPIAQDEEVITVAMAHPEHQRVLQLLKSVLSTLITPVRADPQQIKQALDTVWEAAIDRVAEFVVWADDPARFRQTKEYALQIAAALSLKSAEGFITPGSIAGLLDQSRANQTALIVAAVDDREGLLALLNRSNASILLVRDSVQPPRPVRRILHVLRGHTPDRWALDWVIPIAHACAAEVVLLSAAIPTITDYKLGNPLNNHFADLLSANDPSQIHEYTQILSSEHVQGRLKVVQGGLTEVFIGELLAGSYDLVIIATEAFGDFVYEVLQHIPHNHSAFLVVKP